MSPNPLRNIPSVNELLENPALKTLVDRVSHNAVVTSVRSVLEEIRDEFQNAAAEGALPSVAELAERVAGRVLRGEEPSLRPVINATGILLHTGLGRAPLAEEAVEELVAVARDYASVELDLGSGKRSRRIVAVEGLIEEITGAEAAMVVNNNAGATMLTLSAVAAGGQVIVSRGELVEIGGSYRLPDVMAASGAVLREVGSTNKTHLADYAQAIDESTAALMLVHPSNYVVMGFAASVDLKELVELGHGQKLPVIHDAGSGALIDFEQFGFSHEPVISQSIKTGADLVLFSGDKLLGGPQCGIIVGRRELIDKLNKHPMARALRVDKLTLAALWATLRLYRKPEIARQRIPLLSLLGTSIENLRNRAERLAPQMAAAETLESAETIDSTTFLGGGSIPTQQIPTCCIALKPTSMSVDRLATSLRTGRPSVVGRIQDERLLLDLRTVMPRQDQALVDAVAAVRS
jgi:L-seryl-tRNA(Ser) seleniumtransferase